eukprot:1427237-Pleurochrysis_carterae.AAC.1
MPSANGVNGAVSNGAAPDLMNDFISESALLAAAADADAEQAKAAQGRERAAHVIPTSALDVYAHLAVRATELRLEQCDAHVPHQERCQFESGS